MGGRESRGSNGKSGGSGGAVTNVSAERKVSILIDKGMTKSNAERYVYNENKANKLERELTIEMSSIETKHSIGWREDIQKEINKLREENSKLRWG